MRVASTEKISLFPSGENILPLEDGGTQVNQAHIQQSHPPNKREHHHNVDHDQAS